MNTHKGEAEPRRGTHQSSEVLPGQKSLIFFSKCAQLGEETVFVIRDMVLKFTYYAKEAKQHHLSELISLLAKWAAVR